MSSSKPATIGPGSRWWMPGIALKMCVTSVAPASKAARARYSSASVCPIATTTPAATNCRTASSAPGSSGAIVTCLMQPSPASSRVATVASIGLAQELGGVSSTAPDREEGALEVRADDGRVALGERRDHAEARDDVVERVGHERDHRAGGAVGAVRRERLTNLVGPVVVRGTPAAVPVQVDEPGGERAAGQVDRGRGGRRSILTREAGRRDAIALEEDPAVSGAVGVEQSAAGEQCRGHASPSGGERATTGR